MIEVNLSQASRTAIINMRLKKTYIWEEGKKYTRSRRNRDTAVLVKKKKEAGKCNKCIQNVTVGTCDIQSRNISNRTHLIFRRRSAMLVRYIGNWMSAKIKQISRKIEWAGSLRERWELRDRQRQTLSLPSVLISGIYRISAED